MNKKGAEGGLWLKIFYFILALVIVVFTYNFLSGRIEDNLYLGYVSRESGLNVDAGLSAPDGKIVIREEFRKSLLFKFEKDKVFVKNPGTNRNVEYGYVKNDFYDEFKSESAKEVKTVSFVKDEQGVEVKYG